MQSGSLLQWFLNNYFYYQKKISRTLGLDTNMPGEEHVYLIKLDIIQNAITYFTFKQASKINPALSQILYIVSFLFSRVRSEPGPVAYRPHFVFKLHTYFCIAAFYFSTQ